jgi:hypothetical protein
MEGDLCRRVRALRAAVVHRCEFGCERASGFASKTRMSGQQENAGRKHGGSAASSRDKPQESQGDWADDAARNQAGAKLALSQAPDPRCMEVNGGPSG